LVFIEKIEARALIKYIVPSPRTKANSKMSSSSKMPTSKIVRKKRPQVATDPNVERIKAYQMVEGFTRCPVAPDGNCFYTATGFFCGLNAAEMRELVMKYFIFKKAEYSIFFESESDFMKAVKLNSNSRVWNSELCDIAPHAAAQIMRRDIIIHNYDGKVTTEIRTPVESMPLHLPLHLFRSNDHFEILLDNSKKPNTNICPLPDVTAFNEVIDLTFSDSEDDDEKEPDIEEKEDDVCMIRF
jgi:hypothetical protein